MTKSYQAFGLLLAQIWGDGAGQRVMRPAGSNAAGLMLAADREGHRHLLAPIPDDHAFEEQTWETMRLSEWRHGSQRYIDLACISDSLSHVFANLADDVTRRVEEGGEDPAFALQQTLIEWRKLLKAASAMSEEEARGLFGELVVLSWLVSRNPHYALDCWTGPDSDPHDFTTPRGDLEVKTSARPGLDVVISSLEQLDPPQDRPLLLVRVHVQNSPQGRNIADMVDALSQAGLLKDELISKLAGAGFAYGSDPDRFRFALGGEPSSWLVDEDFPGLRKSDIEARRRTAIKQVRYTLDLVAASDPLTDDQVQAQLDRMMSA